jgi:ABC-type nitrate/sulfonate/bicarbonate transport system substrate-binding protein
VKFLMLRMKNVSLALAILAACGNAIPGHAQQGAAPMRQIVNVELNSLPFVVAHEEGIYKRNGLNVEPCISRGGVSQRAGSGMTIPADHVCARRGSGPDINDELSDANPEAGPFAISGGGPRVVQQMRAGRLGPTVIIANFDPVTNWMILSRKEITEPVQLKGKRIGITGYSNINGYMAFLFAQAMGWDPHSSDITIVSGQRELENLRRGDVDAAVVVSSVAVPGIAQGFVPLVDMRDWKIPMIGNSLHVGREWLRDNRDTARRYVKSMVEALALIKKDRQVAYRAMAKWYGWTDPQQQAELYTYLTQIPGKPYPTEEQISRYLKIYFPNQVWPLQPTDFYDDSLLRELDQSGYIDSLYK